MAARNEREHEWTLAAYFLKGTDLSVHTPAELQRVAKELNTRLRKTLGWTTPAALFDSLKSTAV